MISVLFLSFSRARRCRPPAPWSSAGGLVRVRRLGGASCRGSGLCCSLPPRCPGGRAIAPVVAAARRVGAAGHACTSAPPHVRPRGRFCACARPRSLHRDPEGRERDPKASASSRRGARRKKLRRQKGRSPSFPPSRNGSGRGRPPLATAARAKAVRAWRNSMTSLFYRNPAAVAHNADGGATLTALISNGIRGRLCASERHVRMTTSTDIGIELEAHARYATFPNEQAWLQFACDLRGFVASQKDRGYDIPTVALVQIAGAGKRPVLYCRDFKLGARHSTLQAQVDLGYPDVPVRIVPCGCDASIRCRRS